MDDQSLELFNIISILKKVTKKQEILEDIKNLETEIIDLNYHGNNSYKISLRICKIWKYAVHLFGNIDESEIELGFGFKWDYIFNCFKLHCAVKINSSQSFIYDYSEFFEYFFSEEEQYYKVNEIPNKAWLWLPFESIINMNDNQIEDRLIKNFGDIFSESPYKGNITFENYRVSKYIFEKFYNINSIPVIFNDKLSISDIYDCIQKFKYSNTWTRNSDYFYTIYKRNDPKISYFGIGCLLIGYFGSSLVNFSTSKKNFIVDNGENCIFYGDENPYEKLVNFYSYLKDEIDNVYVIDHLNYVRSLIHHIKDNK